PSIKNGYVGAVRNPLAQEFPNCRMHIADIFRLRRPARADGPNGLVRHNEAIAVDRPGKGFRHLAAHDLLRLPGIALRLCLAHADDRHEPRTKGRRRFAPDDGAALAVIPTPFRVADDDIAAAEIGKHLRAHVAGVRTLGFGMTVLSAD